MKKIIIMCQQDERMVKVTIYGSEPLYSCYYSCKGQDKFIGMISFASVSELTHLYIIIV